MYSIRKQNRNILREYISSDGILQGNFLQGAVMITKNTLFFFLAPFV